MYLNALGQPVLVLNSLKAVSELLDRRATIYSDRPRFIMAQEILSGNLIFSFLNRGNESVLYSLVQLNAGCTNRLVHSRWRRSRRAAHQCLTKSAIRRHHNVLLKEGALLATTLLASPGALKKKIERASASSIMSILYDYPTLETKDDKTVKEIHAFMDRLSMAAAPGTYLVELLPWMLHIPERWAQHIDAASVGLSDMTPSQICQVEA